MSESVLEACRHVQRQRVSLLNQAAFTNLSWGDLDNFAILQGGGIATVEPSFSERSLQWLRSKSYEIVVVDFDAGIGPVVAGFGLRFGWEKQFGYVLEASDRNLARLSDGFWFDIPDGQGLVLELRNTEKALAEDKAWTEGFLRLISKRSLHQLALGRRFFAVVHVTDGDSPLVGCPLVEKSVPWPYPMPQLPVHIDKWTLVAGGEKPT
jgi:hypothetical protein